MFFARIGETAMRWPVGEVTANSTLTAETRMTVHLGIRSCNPGDRSSESQLLAPLSRRKGESFHWKCATPPNQHPTNELPAVRPLARGCHKPPDK